MDDVTRKRHNVEKSICVNVSVCEGENGCVCECKFEYVCLCESICVQCVSTGEGT